MFKMKVSSIVTRMVELERDWMSRNTPVYLDPVTNRMSLHGIGLQLRLQMFYYLDEDRVTDSDQHGEISRYAEVFFMFCGNVSVFMAINPVNADGDREFRFPNINKELWNNTSNHDSCWRTDGIESELNKVYFQMAEEIINEVSTKTEGRTKLAPRDLESYCSFGTNTRNFQQLKIEHEAVDIQNTYHRRIVDVVEI